jgi:hypothetical protein
MHYLSACCIAKKEQPYIREWVDYHRLVGVEAFHVYDDGDPGDEPLAETLREHVASGLVQVHRSIGERRQQMQSYDDCLARHGAGSRWIAFIDVDEFLVPRSHADLRELLAAHEAEAGFAASWLTFGSSGHRTRPPGLVTWNYVLRSEAGFQHNTHVKSIVQPQRTLSARNPHAFDYRPGQRCVDERGRLVPDAFMENTTRTVQVNHYFTKSRAEFLEKAARGRADGGRFLKRQFGRFDNAEEMFEDFDRHCSVVEDRFIQRYTAPLRPAAVDEPAR